MRRVEPLSPWAAVLYGVLGVGLVLAFVGLLDRPDRERIRIERVEASTRDAVLSITVGHASCGGPRVRVVEQTATSVVVRADHDTRGGCDSVGLTTTVTVQLDSVLGQRSIRLEGSDSGPVACDIEGAPGDRCVAVPPVS